MDKGRRGGRDLAAIRMYGRKSVASGLNFRVARRTADDERGPEPLRDILYGTADEVRGMYRVYVCVTCFICVDGGEKGRF